jgi:multidrug efflux system membrane fusion protein
VNATGVRKFGTQAKISFRAITGSWMNRNPLRNFFSAVAAIVFAAALLPGCNRTAAKQLPPPPAVTVSQPAERSVIRWDDYSGYLSSPKTVTVNARVSGLIQEAPFQEGAIVHQGDLLFKIDPRPFQADFDNKKAAVEQARATARKARADYDRSSRLLRAQVIAQASYDTDRAASEEADASLSASQAALEASQLNLQWTDVRAPITGRVSRINVTVGNLVNGGSGQATALTTIVSIDPLYCYIDVPQATALHYQELALEEKQGNVAGAKVPCFLQLENETNFPRQGVIDFIDNQVDVNTGTVQIRCVIPNPTSVLTPGLFALTSIPATSRYRTLLIPDAAVNADQNERYLLIVGSDDVVEQRTVKLGAVFGTLRSITEGLKSGEWVIVNGLQYAAPGAKVDPHQAPIPAQALDALESIAERPPDAQGPAMQTAMPSNPEVSAEARQ